MLTADGVRSAFLWCQRRPLSQLPNNHGL